MLRFVFPTESSRQDVQSFYNEFQSDGGTCIGYGGYKNFDRWLAGMNNRISGKNLPAGYVRENFYLCYDGDDMIGVFNLKFELTEFLLNFGGHIGSVAQEQWLRLADARAGARHRPRTRIWARAVRLRRGQLSLGARDNKKRRNIREQAVRRGRKSFCKKVLDRFINPAWAENSVDKICAYCIRHQQANRNIANHHNTLVQNKNPTTKNCGRILAL